LLTERDRELLGFLAEHRLVLAGHVGALLGISTDAADRRLRVLTAGGWVSRLKLFRGYPACYQITPAGLQLSDSRLRATRVDLSEYEHDVGVAWLTLAARSGTFGAVREVIAERTLRSHDGANRDRQPLGVRLGGIGPGGRERLHYPDLVLVTPEGRRIAIELELTSKGRTRRERILGGYGADARIDAVLYLVQDRSVGRAVQASARRLGISDRVLVQSVVLPESMPSVDPRAAQRARSRAAQSVTPRSRDDAGAGRDPEAER
jgi:hypothetical protein